MNELYRNNVIRYLEFERQGKLPNNVYYVDLGRPAGGAIPHNQYSKKNGRFSLCQGQNLGRDACRARPLGRRLQLSTPLGTPAPRRQPAFPSRSARVGSCGPGAPTPLVWTRYRTGKDEQWKDQPLLFARVLTMGKVNQKVEPSPGVLSTPHAPWCCAMSVWQIARPRPNPSPSPLCTGTPLTW